MTLFQTTKLENMTQPRSPISGQLKRVLQPIHTTPTDIGAKSVIAATWETISFWAWTAIHRNNNPTTQRHTIVAKIFAKVIWEEIDVW